MFSLLQLSLRLTSLLPQDSVNGSCIHGHASVGLTGCLEIVSKRRTSVAKFSFDPSGVRTRLAAVVQTWSTCLMYNTYTRRLRGTTAMTMRISVQLLYEVWEIAFAAALRKG